MKYFGLTDRGKMRKTNQDSYSIAAGEQGDVFAMVCDGIGGGRGGDVASQMAVTHFSRAFSDHRPFRDGEDLKCWLLGEINKTNREIHAMGDRMPSLKGMGTTLTGVVLSDVGRYIVNIGDSRTYAFDWDGKLKQLTEDDSLVNEMVKRGELTPEEAKDFPRRNVLTNALGVWDHTRARIFRYDTEAAGFLVCSDGLHGYVSDGDISDVLGRRDMDPALKVRSLFNLAMDAGGYDNVTIILVDLEEEGKEETHGRR